MNVSLRMAIGLVWLGWVTACGSGDSREGDASFAGDSETPAGDGGGGSTPLPSCTTTPECPTGHTCESGRCVPPEQETDTAGLNRPPVASPRYVYALNPSSDSLARIDPATLSIEAIPVGAGPEDLAVLPGEDAAVVLSKGDGTLTLVDSTTLPSRVFTLELERPQARLALSPDGAYLLAFADPLSLTSSTAEGIVTLVDLKALRAGAPASQSRFERAAGFRVTDIVFRTEAGVTTRAYVFAKSTVTVIELATAASTLPSRLTLPEPLSADIRTREIVATPDGQHIVLRSTQSAELTYFDGATFQSVALPEVATDLDLSADGLVAVAALRAAKRLAILEIPQDLLTPAGIELVDVGGVEVGQVVLPKSAASAGSFALVFSSSTDEESVARVSLPGGTVTRYPLEKRVQEVGLSEDGAAMVVLHRSHPDSMASDEYDRAVDQDEGYSVVDLATGYSQLRRTGRSVPGPFSFSASSQFLGVALQEPDTRRYALDAVDLRSLVARAVPLASKPLFMGPVPGTQSSGSVHRVFVSQAHIAGRISVISLDSGETRTASGFTLNAEIR